MGIEQRGPKNMALRFRLVKGNSWSRGEWHRYTKVHAHRVKNCRRLGKQPRKLPSNFSSRVRSCDSESDKGGAS